jgi:hypothetical protein
MSDSEDRDETSAEKLSGIMAKIEQAEALHSEGLSHTEIGVRMNIPESAIAKLLSTPDFKE